MANLKLLRLEIEEIFKRHGKNFTEEMESEDFKEFARYCDNSPGKTRRRKTTQRKK